MNKFILLIAIAGLFKPISSFGQDWVNSTVIAASDMEPRYSAIDSDNNLYVLTYFTDTIYSPINIVSYGLRDLFVLKFNPSGVVLWSKRIGNISSDVTGGLALDNSNNVYVTGAYYDNTCRFTETDSLTNKGSGDIFIAKYSSDGTFLWTKRVGSASTMESSFDLRYDGNDRLIMAGFYKDSLIIGSSSPQIDTILGNPYTSNFIAAFNLNAELIWAKGITGTNNLSRIRRADISQNGYYFGGYFRGDLFFDIGTISSLVSTTYDAFVYKTDFDGNGQWVRRIRGLNTENFRTLTTDEFDNVYILGNFNSPTIYVDSTETEPITFSGNTGGYDTYICKYNRSGVLQWFLRKGSTAKDIYNDFVVRNNVIFATGYFTNQIVFNNDTLETTGINNSDAFVAAFNQIGDPIAGVSIIGTGDYEDAGTIVNMDANSRAYVSGYYKSQEIKIGDQTYTSSNVNKNDLFFAIYQHPFKAVITDELMISCNGQVDGMLRATPYFGRPPYTYSWSHNASLNNPVADNLPAGTYTVTITDANDSIASISREITEPDLLSINGLITAVSCADGSDGAIDLTVTGGTKGDDYLYFWTTIDGSGIIPLNEDQSGLSRGTYAVAVHDANNCADTVEFLVTQPLPVNYAGTTIIDIVKPIPPGPMGSINLKVNGGNAPFAFAWSGPDGFTASSEDIANLDTAGLYYLTLTDSKNCLSDTSFAVKDNFTFFVQVTGKTDVLCHGANDGTATVTVFNGTKPYSYSWDGGLAMIDSIKTGLTPGNHTVTVTDASFRMSQATVKINTPASALNLVLDAQDLRCHADSSGVVNLTVTGGTVPYNYSWSNGYQGEDLVNVAAGSYIVTVTDYNNCPAQADTGLSEPVTIGLDIAVAGTILCAGDQGVTATANTSGGTGSFAYLWDDPGAQTTKTAFDLEAGTYHVIVTDANGCTETGLTLITEPDAITVQATLNDPSCPGLSDGSIIPVVSGGTPGFDYEWSNNVFERINDNLPAGEYTLRVTDDNNCSLVQEYTLNNPDTVKIVSVTVTDPTCAADPDGSASIVVSGGSGIYEYSADNGETFGSNATIGSLDQGDYSIVVRDNKACLSAAYPVTLEEPGGCGLVIYDAFSPNGDSYNAVWNIGNADEFPNIKVKIFNLWGNMVFSSTGYGSPWNGIYEGEELPSGTYYYVIDPGDGSETLTGPVSLVK